MTGHVQGKTNVFFTNIIQNEEKFLEEENDLTRE